ncbi:MAG: MtrB/PioB family outer membrane beta-barrel protein, partial [Betaproteobacteria bacterium]|nr:MtrB/PioB family outer membrane beta-barrel protein [Betaproteobacteria bacterium]
ALFGHVAWQAHEMHQAGLQANTCIAGINYYFFSNGAVNTTGVTPAGASLVGTTRMTPADAPAICAAAGPLSPLYPASRAWEHFQKDDNRSAGLGVRRDFGVARLDASYAYADARTTTAYSFNASALGFTPAQVALIGAGFPEARVARNTLEANLTGPIGKAVSARLYVRHERGRIRDWHYDGVAENPVPDVEAAYLDTGPRDYRASTVGLFLRVEF